jgi:predicted phage baseplate assembly protein
MSLPQIQLDDRDFQSLVDEARRRIAHTCPAWNEHNVSDPGITLIELFAWMTELLIYRANQIPERAKIALLDMVGVKLAPAEVARADLRFRLSAPASSWVEIEAGAGEVATARQSQGTPVVFATVEPVIVPPLRLAAVKLVRQGIVSDVSVQDGIAHPPNLEQLGLWSPSEPQDGLYLGFQHPLTALLVAVSVDAATAHGPGIPPQTPPWRWDVSYGEGRWSPATVISDGTGGFNYASGIVELQLPHAEEAAVVAGRELHWLRCRLLEEDEQGSACYTHPPRIQRLHVAAIGALVEAEHAARAGTPRTLAESRRLDAGGEIIGYSDGSPGQVLRVRHLPALKLARDEGLEVIDPKSGKWVAWSVRDSLADSGPDDLHYCFDPISGEIGLGLAIRGRDGWIQRGKIPEQGAAMRMRYRWGGGIRGNVAENTLTVLRRPMPGIASVTNPTAAAGGSDSESLSEALRRAPLEVRARSRAVTAEDYEVLAHEAARTRIARTRCAAPDRGEAIVSVLPSATDPAGHVPYAELQASESLLEEVAQHLDERRLLGSDLRVVPMALCGVTVVTEVQPEAHFDPEQVQQSVEDALYRYINPYIGGSLGGASEGWRFGEPLVVEEVKLAIRAVDGVSELFFARLYRTDLSTGTPDGHPVEDRLEIGPDELVASAKHLVRAWRPQP